MVFSIPISQPQCVAKPENFYEPLGDPHFISEKLVPSDLMVNMFEYLEMLRSEFWYAASMNTTVTNAKDPSCSYVWVGVSLENIKYIDADWNIPLLTNVRIYGQKLFIPGQKANTLMTLQQFAHLADILGLKSNVVMDGHPNIMVKVSKNTLSSF